MNARFLLPVVLWLPFAPVVAQATPAAAVEALQHAIAGSDRKAAAAVLAADVQIFESGYVERSRDEYLAHHFESDAKFTAAVVRKVVRRTEQSAGNMALVLEETETKGSYEGKPIDLIGTETVVLRRDGETWRIVHIHWSSRRPKP